MAAIRQTLKVHSDDNIIVALTDLPAGKTVFNDGTPYLLQTDIPAKHKFAAIEFSPGDDILMYGIIIGRAVTAIARGERITTENIAHAAADYAGREGQYEWRPPDVSRWKKLTFNGYHRRDGRVGTANYWLVIPLVFCENRNVEIMKNALGEILGYAKHSPYETYANELAAMYRAGKSYEEIHAAELAFAGESKQGKQLFPNLDGVKFLTHDSGCGRTEEDIASLCCLLAGYILNPNTAGATILSLGCQKAEMEMLREVLENASPGFDKPIHFFEQQKSRSEQDMLTRAIRATFLGMMQANELRRQPAALSQLSIGMECGGSDGFSGLSANPAMGHCADILAALGGTVLLSEFPELCGVEQALINRSVDEATANKFRRIQSEYAARAAAVGSGFENNPSPGNIRDGLITDAMKSAGAAKKGGTSPVSGVLDYTEQPLRKGLQLLCTPGNDVESTTGMAASGANLMLFSTGLGTPTGNPVTPVIKVATNTILAQRMPDIIDFNAGTVITGENSVEECGEALFDLCLRAANGEYIPKAVLLGQDDFIPWKRGVSL